MGKMSERVSTLHLAKIAIVEAGSTPEEAADALIAGGVDVDALAAKGRAKLDADEEAIRAQVYAESSEGRLEAGQKALAAEAERAEKLQAARALLRANGDALADDYDHEGPLHVSGILPRSEKTRESGSLGREALAARDARWAADRAAELAYAERGRSDG
jgi:hypothetical protein